MEPIPTLPLPIEALPEAARRYGTADAPKPARMMAAKGLVPLKGTDLVVLLVQLTADSDAAIADSAGATLTGLPDGVLLAACEAPLPAAVLDQLADRCGSRPEVLDRLVQNHATADATVARAARSCGEALAEIIATNQQRLLGAPSIIEALYKNKQVRMSTADRLVELAARNGVELTGIPAFHAHVEAIQGMLIPEPTDEPLPSDLMFIAALAADADDDAIERDRVDGTETLRDEFQPLSVKIADMNPAEKVRMAMIGNAAARTILVRDKNRTVAHAAISSPMMTETEATNIAHSKEVAEDILRYIGNKREWLRSYEIKRALVFNPKTPAGIALRFIGHMRDNDLKTLGRSRNVPAPIKTAATQRLQLKQKG